MIIVYGILWFVLGVFVSLFIRKRQFEKDIALRFTVYRGKVYYLGYLGSSLHLFGDGDYYTTKCNKLDQSLYFEAKEDV